MSYENLSTARHGIKNFKGRLEIDGPMERVAHVLLIRKLRENGLAV
ncbi:MAG: hypothetical protein ACPG97_11305 [Paracoccaceae bacterium]